MMRFNKGKCILFNVKMIYQSLFAPQILVTVAAFMFLIPDWVIRHKALQFAYGKPSEFTRGKVLDDI